MGETIILIAANLGLVVVDVFLAVLFSEMIESILTKDRSWFGFLLVILGSILLQAAVYSWLPGHFGYTIELLEGAIPLKDGAVFSNLGALLVAEAVAIGFLLVKYVWSVIRKKSSFQGKFFVLENIFMIIFGVAGIALFENEDIIAFSSNPEIHTTILIAMSATGFVLIAAGVRSIKKKWGTKKTSKG